MPHIIMKRSDIPAGTLQVLDLWPNESQRNQIYDPPGQTKYVNPVQRAVPQVATIDNITTIRQEVSGLEAWFISRVTQGGNAMTPAQAVTAASAVLGLLNFGSLAGAAGNLELATVNGALATNDLDAAQHAELLEVLAGRSYTLPRGVQIADTGALAVAPAVGAEGGPFWGPHRPVFDTDALTISASTGKLAGYTSADFMHLGVGGDHGEAVVVYNDDGSLF